jgi:hypothetical protein
MLTSNWKLEFAIVLLAEMGQENRVIKFSPVSISPVKVLLTDWIIALLQAIAERLIPGISDTLRIASLEQIVVDRSDKSASVPLPQSLVEEGQQNQNLSSLDYVIHNDVTRDNQMREFNC